MEMGNMGHIFIESFSYSDSGSDSVQAAAEDTYQNHDNEDLDVNIYQIENKLSPRKQELKDAYSNPFSKK